MQRPTAGHAPVVPVRIRARVEFDTFGIVDSGSGRALLPKAVAARLGIADAELAPDPGGGGGVGSKFPTWSSTIPIQARVFYKTAQGGGAFHQEASGFVPFGDWFDLNTGFKEGDCPVLMGRDDFFKAFVVTFDHNGGNRLSTSTADQHRQALLDSSASYAEARMAFADAIAAAKRAGISEDEIARVAGLTVAMVEAVAGRRITEP